MFNPNKFYPKSNSQSQSKAQYKTYNTPWTNTHSDKPPICLVLTCKRPFYTDRRNKNKDMWELVTRAGFTVMFLFADPTLTKPQFDSDSESDYSTLTVPCTETYEYLTQKMQLAYSVLAGTCSGILKMDDNTRINDPSCLAELHQIIQTYDYFGVEQANINQSSIKLKQSNYCRFPASFNKLEAVFDKSLSYFTGTFYWVSNNVLQEIAKNQRAFEYPWEDVALSYFISKFPHSKILYLPWKPQNRVTWDKNTESVDSLKIEEKERDKQQTMSQQKPICRIALNGQLGNHLFQMAALLRHCHVNNMTPQFYIVDPRKPYERSLYKCTSMRTNAVVPVRGVPFHYIPFHPSQTLLFGYCQSSKYFADVSGLVRELFDPHPDLKFLVREKYSDLFTEKEKETSVVVHVRRGDYMTGANKTFHGILTEKYFLAAMAEMRSRIKDAKFLVFSDDADFCRRTFTGPDVQVVDEPDGEIAFHLMCQFRHYIMSNSSFSWWATYLGEPAETVISPDKWFGPAGPQDYQDIYEPGWIRMPSL